MTRLFAMSVVTLLCLTHNLLAQNISPQVYKLAQVRVEGAQQLSSSAIRNMSGLQTGDEISVPSDISQGIKRLWKQDLFAGVSVRQDSVIEGRLFISVLVTERPRISAISFTGISKSQTEALREKLSLVSGTIWTAAKRKSTQRIVRNYFVEKGFYQTQVSITEKPSPLLKNRTEITIAIDKGNYTKINQIDLVGNKDFPDKWIWKNLRGVKVKKGWPFWARSKYIPHELRDAQKNVLMAYQNEGFRDVTVELDTVYLHDEKSLNIQLKVYEGKKYHYRQIEWVGNNRHNQEALSAMLDIKPGDVYKQPELMTKLNADPAGQDIRSRYMDEGYLFFQIDPVESRVVDDSVDLQIHIVEGPQTTIRNVLIEGNTKTSDEVILRMLRTYPGKKFSRSDIIRSQRELLSLGHFNQETLNVIPVPDMETGTVDLKYIVEETASDKVQLQLGWSPNSADQPGGGLVGTVQLNLNNFSTKRLFGPRSQWGHMYPAGDDQKLSLAMQMNGSDYQKVSFSFLEPWLGGRKPHSLGVSTSYSIFSDQESTYKNRIFSFSVDHGRQMSWPDDYFRSFTSLNYKYYDVTNPATIFSNSFVRSDGTAEPVAFVNQLSLKQTFQRNSLDAALFPRSGSNISFSVEVTPPYSLFSKKDYSQLEPAEKFNLLEYHKWTFNSSWYWQLFGDVVLNAKIQAGYLGSYNKNVGGSPFERFHVGGTGIANGFTLDGRDFIPLRGYEDASLDNDGQGFSLYNRFVLELRVPLSLDGPVPAWVVGFAEAGNGYDGIKDYNPFRLKRSLGVGIRGMLPSLGLMGVDYGYGFDNEDGKGGHQFHLILGKEF